MTLKKCRHLSAPRLRGEPHTLLAPTEGVIEPAVLDGPPPRAEMVLGRGNERGHSVLPEDRRPETRLFGPEPVNLPDNPLPGPLPVVPCGLVVYTARLERFPPGSERFTSLNVQRRITFRYICRFLRIGPVYSLYFSFHPLCSPGHNRILITTFMPNITACYRENIRGFVP